MSEIIKELSVILPTYNESESLSLTIENLCSEIKELDFEIIVVDDNSPDKTWKIAEELSKTNKRIK